MKIKKVVPIVAFHASPEEALNTLSKRINIYLNDQGITELETLSHSVIEIANNDESRRFMASTLISSY